MNKKILALLVVLMLSLVPMTALAYDQKNPATYSVNMIVVMAARTFTVTTFDGSTTEINFQGKAGESVDPCKPPGYTDCQTTSNAWAKIANTGEVDLDFAAVLASTPETGITLKAADNYGMTTNLVTLSTTHQHLHGAATVLATDPDSFFDVFLKASFGSGMSEGTYTNSLSIRNYLPAYTKVGISGPSSVSLAAGGSATYTMIGLDQHDNLIALPTGVTATSWSSSNVLVGTIDGSGSFAGIDTGTTTITVTASDGKTGTKTVTVT